MNIYRDIDTVSKLSGQPTYKESSSQKKLKRQWDGPFVVRKCVAPSVYLLQGKKKTIIDHRDRLKPCKLEEDDLPRWAKKVVAHCRELPCVSQ